MYFNINIILLEGVVYPVTTCFHLLWSWYIPLILIKRLKDWSKRDYFFTRLRHYYISFKSTYEETQIKTNLRYRNLKSNICIRDIMSRNCKHLLQVRHRYNIVTNNCSTFCVKHMTVGLWLLELEENTEWNENDGGRYDSTLRNALTRILINLWIPKNAQKNYLGSIG